MQVINSTAKTRKKKFTKYQYQLTIATEIELKCFLTEHLVVSEKRQISSCTVFTFKGAIQRSPDLFEECRPKIHPYSTSSGGFRCCLVSHGGWLVPFYLIETNGLGTSDVVTLK